MHPLDRKLIRDFRRLSGQALAIALVMAAGVATLILAVGAYRSLEETRSAYYERYRFADIFASATRAPTHLKQRILQIPGVAAVETRIAEFALLDVASMVQPATGMAISLPDHREVTLNRLFVRRGRLPQTGRVDEVAIDESFANAHGMDIGATFSAILNGRKRALRVVGIALSPEFIYALGPGDVIPDPKRFGVLWMSQKTLEAIFDLDGAFNSVSVKLLRNTDEAETIKRLDDVLERYGGSGAYGRKDQQSHAFIDAELKQLQGMARVIPPIFLAVSAFLINMTLMRLIALEREQIGLLKALGYWRRTIAAHYLKLVVVIAGGGILIGFAGGTLLGQGLTRLYGDFFHFPFLIFQRNPDIYVIAAAISLAAAVAGALRALYSALTLPPAVAMSPPAPIRYRHLGLEHTALFRHVTQLTMMALRHMIRFPVRTGLTILGVAMSVSLLIVALFSLDSIEYMIDATFFRADRQDATITFVDERPLSVMQAVERLPGVLRAEPFRSVPVRLRHGHLHRKIAISGKPPQTDLSRVLDLELRPVTLPEAGLVLSEHVANELNVRPGQRVEVEVLEGRRAKLSLPVSQIIQTYLGMAVYMDNAALSEILDESVQVSGAHIAYDGAATEELFEAVKNLPAVSAIALQKTSLARFRETLAQTIYIMTTVYIALSGVIAFGVVYNSARIQLSERSREFASLRVLGFTRNEVSRVMFTELATLVLLAIPLGYLIGYGFASVVVKSFESDLYRMPFIIAPSTYAVASIVVLIAAGFSALMVHRRINRLDLVSALNTRE